jgi:hypothetical protein
MSDSFKKSLQQEKAGGGDRQTDVERKGDNGGGIENPPDQVFHSINHITALCQDCRVEIGIMGNFLYSKGWREVVDDLIRELKDCNITITEVKEHFGRLVVRFMTDDQQVEIKAWRAVNVADITASRTCEMCGGRGTLGVHRNHMVGVLCDNCKDKHSDRNLGRPKRTGTWLDQF